MQFDWNNKNWIIPIFNRDKHVHMFNGTNFQQSLIEVTVMIKKIVWLRL